MPDCQLNRPLTVGVQLFDAAGQPQTSGVTATLSVYGPSDPATPRYTAPATLQGGAGLWGGVVPATVNTAAGVYRYTLTGVADGAGDGALGGLYTVGQVTPGQATLWDLYLGITRALRDGHQGRATTLTVAGGTVSLTDPYYAYGAANNWNGAQVLLPYTVTPTDTNPLRVAAFAPASGTFTLAPAPAALPTAPANYLLGGLRGFSHGQKLDALMRAIRDAHPRLRCSDEVSLTGTIFNFEYAIPDSWTQVRGVYLRNKVSAWKGDWQEVAPIHWSVRQDRRLLRLDYQLTSLVQIRVDGRFEPALPQFFGSIVDAPAEFVTNRALEYLCAESADPADRAALQYYAAKAQESEPVLVPDPNEVSL